MVGYPDGTMWGDMDNRRFDCYVPRLLLRHLATASKEPVLTLGGSVVFVDLSGFTRLSERLARRGREGAEQLAETIDSCFSVLLADAYGNGGSLLKFGGDALLLWFDGEGHPSRACASAVEMRRTLRRIGRVRAGETEITLRMSVGIHSGTFETFLVGGSHREYLIAGPAASTVGEMEAAASAGQILLSEQTAGLVPNRYLGEASGPGILLTGAPEHPRWRPDDVSPLPPNGAVAACLSTALRRHLDSAPAAPEHRTATVAFLQFGALDGLVLRSGAPAAAKALDELVRFAQDAADRYEICFLKSDIAADGGKLVFSAGAPRAVGDDEERMLLAMRQILDASPALPIRIGINRGNTFTGEVGPDYRRTYDLMGDAMNLAARLAAKAPWGGIYTLESVLARSRTRFATIAVPPFAVKGKLRPVAALELGAAIRPAWVAAPTEHLPLIGRDRELRTLGRAMTAARGGRGGLIEIVGETGSGKSRLLAEARSLDETMRVLRVACGAYTRGLAYAASRDLLRQLLDARADDSDECVLDRLRRRVEQRHPQLVSWLPLLAIAAGIEAPSTRAVEELSPDFRTAKLHEAVLSFLAPALSTPTLLKVEHAHLMDDASARLFDALAGELGGSSWIVIATRREATSGFRSPAASTRIELQPLSPEAILALAESTPEAHVIPPHLLRLAVERSGGNPDFLLDLLSAAASGSDRLPESVEAAASARLDAFDPDDRELIRRAAVLGLSFRPARLPLVLAEGAPRPDPETWRQLSAVFAIDPDGQLRFKRPALCEAAYEGLPFRLRRELHAAVGEALEAEIGRELDAEPAVVSLHFSRAGDHVRAWRYALAGAERASAAFAHADAARLYRRAIDSGREAGASEAELGAAYEALGEALRQAGDRTAANHAFASARRKFRGRAIDQARLCYRHAVAAERRGSAVSAVRWANRGLRELDRVQGEEAGRWRAQLLSALGGVRQRQGHTRQAEAACRQAIAEAEAAGELLALAHACYILDYVLVETERSEEATHSARALEIYQELGDPERESAVLNNLGMFAYWRGSWDEAIDFYRRQGACSERSGNPANVAYTDCNVGEILSDQGHLAEAAQHLQRARRIWSSTGDAPGVAFANLQLGRIATRQGRYEEALSMLTAGAGQLRAFRLDGYAEFADGLVAEAEAFGGDMRRALEMTEALLPRADRDRPLLHRVRGVALARLGRADSAMRALEASLLVAVQRNSHYDVAATLDVMTQIVDLDWRRMRLLRVTRSRLHIESLPEPVLASRRDELEGGKGPALAV